MMQMSLKIVYVGKGQVNPGAILLHTCMHAVFWLCVWIRNKNQSENYD